MSSYTFNETQTFSITHAKHLASKVATDLKRFQRFYGQLSDIEISDFETEIIELLRKGYLGTVTYGFKKDGNWIEPALRYTAKDLAGLASEDDDPGKIRPNAQIGGASFYSFLTYSSTWDFLSQIEKDNFKKTLPFQRGGATEPGINGYLSNDKTYSSGGKALDRSTVKSY